VSILYDTGYHIFCIQDKWIGYTESSDGDETVFRVDYPDTRSGGLQIQGGAATGEEQLFFF